MKILFLDDFQDRHDIFREQYSKDHRITHVYTAEEAIEALKVDKFDLLHLDHDLEGIYEYDFQMKNCGSAVAEWIKANLSSDKYPRQVVIHSWNVQGAENMKSLITPLGIPVELLRFSTFRLPSRV